MKGRPILLLVAVMLCHHIEGVCKPWSAATLAAREAAERVAAAAAALVAESRVGRAVRAVQAAESRRQAGAARAAEIERSRSCRRSVDRGQQRQAVEPPPVVVDGFVISVETEAR